MSKEYDYLIVGAGLSGSVFAHEAKRRGYKCLVIDKRSHTGGNTRCCNNDGINVHLYGPHIFHTDNKEVWNYVNSFVEFNRFTNSPLACVDGELYNLPFNMNTLYQLWHVHTPQEAKLRLEHQREKYSHIDSPANLEEQALKLCGDDIYNLFIKGYTEKQWGRKCSDLPASIIKRIPLRFTFDNNYFNDRYQGIPTGGYNRLINLLLDGIEVRLGVDYVQNRNELNQLAGKVFYTGCIDEYFGYMFGKLEYRSLRFEHKVLNDTDNFQGNAVVNYTDRQTPYTRIIEHKHFEFCNQPHTIITYEYPEDYKGTNEPYYPINDEQNNALYAKYKAQADKQSFATFCGRLAEYKYYDMDDVIENVLKLWK
jgi:UDP-galactopyranose mutase